MAVKQTVDLLAEPRRKTNANTRIESRRRALAQMLRDAEAREEQRQLDRASAQIQRLRAAVTDDLQHLRLELEADFKGRMAVHAAMPGRGPDPATLPEITRVDYWTFR